MGELPSTDNDLPLAASTSRILYLAYELGSSLGRELLGGSGVRKNGEVQWRFVRLEAKPSHFGHLEPAVAHAWPHLRSLKSSGARRLGLGHEEIRVQTPAH